MEPCGYFQVYRKIFKHFKKPYTEMEAWIWCIGEAAYCGNGRGTFAHSLRYLARAWGWQTQDAKRKPLKDKVNRVLHRWRNRGWIEFKTATPSATPSETENATMCTCVIIVKYDEMQTPPRAPATPSATGSATGSATERKEEEKKLRKELRTPLPPKGGSRSSRAIHDPEKLTEILNGMDITPFEQKYGSVIDVPAVWQRFKNRVIGAGNPRHYLRFEQAFDNWCLLESQDNPVRQTRSTKKPWIKDE